MFWKNNEDKMAPSSGQIWKQHPQQYFNLYINVFFFCLIREFLGFSINLPMLP